MEEVRQLVQEEGREARNLVAFHVAVDTPSRISRKPPRAGPPPRRAAPLVASRMRSASAGRDKRSELRARYWALLFGDLQRAIGEIYNTVEAHENLNECQEVILVLENYTRDFKALGEWFRLKWEYDNTPPPQRPQSLTWEIRKTDFVRPESRRTHSVKSSPSVSGKNSPCLSGHNTPSGKNSPSLTGKASPGSGKMSPRISPGHSSTSPKGSIEFFSTKVSSKVTTKPEPKVAKETRLSDIKEKEVKDVTEKSDEKNGKEDVVSKENVDKGLIIIKKMETDVVVTKNNIDKGLPSIPSTAQTVVEVGKAKECQNTCPKPVVIKSPKHSITSKFIAKNITSNKELSSHAKATVAQLDAMENEFLAKQLTVGAANNENLLNQDIEHESCVKTTGFNILNQDDTAVVDEKERKSAESPAKSEDNFADVSNESSKSSDGKSSTENIYITEAESIKEFTEINTNEIMSDVDKAVYNNNPDKSVKTTKEVLPEVNELPINAKDVDVKKDLILDNKKESVKETRESDSEINKEQDTQKPEAKNALESKPNNRPAYSQAAAKPKPITIVKIEVKTPTRSNILTRSKTVVEVIPKARQFPKRNQASKCSYPFNLTTGRTSLFDTPSSKGIAQKKPTNRVQIGSGDGKVNQTKVEPKKRPPRPLSLKITEKGDKKEKISPTLEIKDFDEYSSSDTIVAQIDMNRIESSESLKTLVPEEMIQDVANSVEVLNVEHDKGDNEGWLTVKSRRLSRESKKQSKSHWAARYHQPSATISLPTLNMIESPKSETNPIVNSKLDRAKSEQPQTMPDKVVKVSANPKSESKVKDPAIIRQKSDVTGLKTRSARSKALRKEKVKDARKNDGSELTKNRLHSSLESLTTGLARSQESTEEAFDFDIWKAEFKYLEDDDQIANQNELLKAADPSEMSEIAEMTSQIEENERKISWALDFQSEVDQRKLCEEEDLLNRQIIELQQVSDIDLDTETDDTETDAEILCEDASITAKPSTENMSALAVSLEDQYETALAGMSWAERVDTLVVLEALVARDPGRAQQLHAKLSQGIKRRGSFQDALRRLQAKQARAERQRREYQTERAKKIHQLLARVEEVKVAKNQLIEEKRIRMERRLQKAAENRDQHLKDIVRKAHDEEEKLREIAFIKQLEAENRRHEFLDQCRSHTTRLRLMRRERLSKLEQKAAREAAVGARRLALQAARRRRVEALLARRRERDARVEELREQRRQERGDAARERAEGVKSRLWALAAAAELEADALRSRIRDKQDASQQRLESHLQAIREKATGPRQATTSESQDQSTKELEEETNRLEQEKKEREKQKSIKKKARKVRQKLLTTSKETIEHPYVQYDLHPASNKLSKVINQLSNIIAPLIPLDIQPDVKHNGFDTELEGIERNKKNKKNKNKVETDCNENKKDIDENPENTAVKVNDEIENGNGKKKKKKSKDQASDGPKLMKTSSVCSSLSDMSKASNKSERSRLMIDMPFLEKQLNELHRYMERFDKKPGARAPAWRVAGVRAAGGVAAAAARDDLADLFTLKSLTTAVMIISRLITACPASAAHFVSSSLCVRMVKLLTDQLDKDLKSDPKELELAKLLGDCLSVALDSVLISTRLYEEGLLDVESLALRRSRAHTLISYLCLSGCISRAEKAGEARENIQTLLTVCADLCQPCDVDVGSERTSATQSMRCALGTSVCGSRAEFCMLFAQGADLSHSGGFVRAARTAHLLRALAELDHQIVQDAFGEGGWPLEFRAAVARLLSQHAPNDKEAPRTNALRMRTQRLDASLSETMVLDLIVLVGFVVVNNPTLQETICDGWSVIKTLCTLPANWLVSRPHSHALLPTLLALADRPTAAAAIASELSMQMLDEYLRSPEAQKVKLVQVIKQGRAKKPTAKK